MASSPTLRSSAWPGPTGSSTRSVTRLRQHPELIFVGFQLTFAVITVALISGAIADRVKFSTWLVFSGLWVTLAASRSRRMVWGGGLLSGSESRLSSLIFRSTGRAANVAPIDFADGTVVHINAGSKPGLVLALVVGKRLGFGKVAMRPATCRP